MAKALKKMPLGLKRKWIAALRGGEYKQGKSYLRVRLTEGGEHYCCLGVLADVAGCRWRPFMHTYGLGADTNTTMLPERIAARCGLSSDTSFDGRDAQGRLANFNDRGWSFKRIADWIEKNL